MLILHVILLRVSNFAGVSVAFLVKIILELLQGIIYEVQECLLRKRTVSYRISQSRAISISAVVGQ